MFSCGFAKLVVLAFITGTSGNKLSPLENEQIQQVCGHYEKTMKNKIMFGTKEESSEAPWAVPIEVYREEGVMHCSGTLVSSRHVITARHCFVRDADDKSFTYVYNEKNIDLSNCRGDDYIVPPNRGEADIHFATRCRDSEACEKIKLNTDLVTRKPSLVVLPGICGLDLKRDEYQDDIAIIELDEDVLFSEKIHPICIDHENYGRHSSNVTIYGFGHDPSDKRVSTGILRSESSHMIRCHLSEKYLCSFSYNTIQLGCRGDSGGGVVLEKGDKLILIAVLSRGEPCNVERKNQADIHASVHEYLKPICEYTGICKIRRSVARVDVKKLYGHEVPKERLRKGFERKHVSYVVLILIFIIFS